MSRLPARAQRMKRIERTLESRATLRPRAVVFSPAVIDCSRPVQGARPAAPPTQNEPPDDFHRRNDASRRNSLGHSLGQSVTSPCPHGINYAACPSQRAPASPRLTRRTRLCCLRPLPEPATQSIPYARPANHAAPRAYVPFPCSKLIVGEAVP